MFHFIEKPRPPSQVGRDTIGLRADYVLKSELREFQAEYAGANDSNPPRIHVRINAKLVAMPRRTIEAGKTFEALERAGVDMMWDCRKGECGLCQVKVTALDGQVDHRDVFLSADEKAGDDRLCACVSRAVAHGTPRIGDTDEPDDAPPRSPERPAVVTIETT